MELKLTARKAGDPFEREEVAAIAATAETYLRPGAKFRYRPPSRSNVALGVFLLYTGMRKSEGMGLSWKNLNLPKVGLVGLDRPPAGWSPAQPPQNLQAEGTPCCAALAAGSSDSGAHGWTGRDVGFPRHQTWGAADPGILWLASSSSGCWSSHSEHPPDPPYLHHSCPGSGAPIGAVAKAVGHTTVYITEIYGHISDRVARSAAELAGNHIHQLDWKWLNEREGSPESEV